MSNPFISPADSGEVERDFRVHHVFVNPGQDIVSSVKLFASRDDEPRIFYIISADGIISNSTLIQPLSTREIQTAYRGEYEIISIIGTFSNSDQYHNSSRFTVAMKDPNGNVVEGGAVRLTGFSRTLVVLGSFVSPNSNGFITRREPKLDFESSIHHILVDKGKDIIAKMKEFVRRWGRSVRIISMGHVSVSVSDATLFKRINFTLKGKHRIMSLEGTLSPSQSNVDSLLLINSSPIKVSLLGGDYNLIEGVAVKLIVTNQITLLCNLFTEPPPLLPPLLPPSILRILSQPTINQQLDLGIPPPTPTANQQFYDNNSRHFNHVTTNSNMEILEDIHAAARGADNQQSEHMG